jgi:hypothetical protein
MTVMTFNEALGIQENIRKKIEDLTEEVKKWDDHARELALEARRMHEHMRERPGWKESGGGHSSGGKFTDYTPDIQDSPHHVYVYNSDSKKAGSYEYHNFDKQPNDRSESAMKRGDGLAHMKHSLSQAKVFA